MQCGLYYLNTLARFVLYGKTNSLIFILLRRILFVHLNFEDTQQMIDKELIKSIISEEYEYIPQVEIVPRNVIIEPAGNYVLVGVNQAGKSALRRFRFNC